VQHQDWRTKPQERIKRLANLVGEGVATINTNRLGAQGTKQGELKQSALGYKDLA
jgi:hypothetical protein